MKGKSLIFDGRRISVTCDCVYRNGSVIISLAGCPIHS